jgi:hypothetical protein
MPGVSLIAKAFGDFLNFVPHQYFNSVLQNVSRIRTSFYFVTVFLVLGSGEFSILPELPIKMTLHSKVVKRDYKIIISLCYTKS